MYDETDTEKNKFWLGNTMLYIIRPTGCAPATSALGSFHKDAVDLPSKLHAHVTCMTHAITQPTWLVGNCVSAHCLQTEPFNKLRQQK